MTQRQIIQAEYPYFVTANTAERAPIFEGNTLADLLSDILFESARMNHVDLFAFCIMPDHMHVLLHLNEMTKPAHPFFLPAGWKTHSVGGGSDLPPEDADITIQSQQNNPLSSMMKSVKGLFSRQLNQGRVWQPRYNFRIVTTEQRLFNTIRYIRNNPINAGLPKIFQGAPYMYFNDEFVQV